MVSVFAATSESNILPLAEEKSVNQVYK